MKLFFSAIKRIPGLYEFLRYRVYAPLQSKNRKRVFLKIYRENAWGDRSSVSGPGSSLETTAELRSVLPGLLADLQVKSLLDLPCGDLEWIKHVSLGIEKYIGADIVEPLIVRNRAQYADFGEFLRLDLLTDALPAVDAIFCRDCLIHLSNREIMKALGNIARTNAQYLITTTFPDLSANKDTVTPYWRAVNLQLPPYNLPPPVRLVRDYSPLQPDDEQKYLGVWRIGDLRGISSI
ncbi:MAG TPA: class I SAM-dependent methyltransferase [Rhizomicrobium sp.]